MINQWPSEQNKNTQETSSSRFKEVKDFASILELFPDSDFTLFLDAIDSAVVKDCTLSTLERHSSQILTELELQFEDDNLLITTLICAGALASYPDQDTWNKVKEYQSNSWELENWLFEAMKAYCESVPSASEAYTTLAQRIFTALDNFSLSSRSDRITEERMQAWENWERRDNKLEEVWFQLRGWNGFIQYESELPLFGLYYEIDSSMFVDTISTSRNPYLVDSILSAVGIGAFSPKFSVWSNIVKKAPIAFESNGEWNKSVLIPLLLNEAGNQLSQVSSLSYDEKLSANLDEKIKVEIRNTVELVLETLSKRSDVNGIISRWGAFLVRQILMFSEKDLNNVRTRSFAYSVLIDDISEKFDISQLPQEPASDSLSWEYWCYRCLKSWLMHDSGVGGPFHQSFMDEWNLAPEDWDNEKGARLRERAYLFSNRDKDVPSLASKLFALSFLRSESPVDSWNQLWNYSFFIREVVEFGELSNSKQNYSQQARPNELLIIVFDIGLAILDQISSDIIDSNSSNNKLVLYMFNNIFSALNEMLEIDDTINQEKWKVRYQHLVIRRVIWQRSNKSDEDSNEIYIFDINDSPTVPQMLSKLKNNVSDLYTVLQSLLLNTSETRIAEELKRSSIDLNSITTIAEKLNSIRPQKYPINTEQLEKLKSLSKSFSY